MDPTTYVSIFCNELAKADKGQRKMAIYYIWEDKREGSLEERFRADCQEWNDFQRMVKP